ncbi:MAG TPA: TIGR04222 domain-containing membrane protein [Candidatus Dormibacteraeota bacterium]|nr:TIGR04222 domain-containing membrane protein [Candidatus Dormibacteraeota bacterium]
MLSAIERQAAWLVQHGGGWVGTAVDWLSTYGLHVLFLATLLACTIVLRRLHRTAIEAPEADPEQFRFGPRSSSPHGMLFPYEAAYLAGGPLRVAETALTSLVDEGWVESAPSGRLRLGSRDELVRTPDPVAVSVLGIVASGPPATAREVRRRAARAAEVLDVSGILYARRLLLGPPARRRLRLLRWAATGLLALAGTALLLTAFARSPDLRSPPVAVAAAELALGLVAPALSWRRAFFRTALGERVLASLQGAVCDKARWVACRVWSDESGTPASPWADVDRIGDALGRPAAGRPVQLGWLWGREDALMAVAVRGPRGIPDPGLRKGLDGARRSPATTASSTGLSTPVHNIVGSGDPAATTSRTTRQSLH